ncbi:MAG TPA: RNA polymerase subunit sigma-70 [Thermoleophilaceae bacterium]|nr:RNA polymerase subunit sigma-70 [Thermoleophilaceae bacterium]
MLTAASEDIYSQLIEPHRAELRAHCYRMLGSVHDAEDALQEALLRAWKALPRFEGRSSVRTWLYRIVTNTCLDLLERRPRQPAEWPEPYPDELLEIEDGLASPVARYEQRESVELAFVAALQHLPATQRAALLLRDVLGFSAKETAAALDTTVPSANGALRRARAAVDARLPERSQQATLRELGDDEVRAIVERYADALERGDLDAMVAMLAEDASFSMPPLPDRFDGLEEIVPFLARGPFRVRWRHLPVRASGQAAVACYMWDSGRGAYVFHAIDVITLRDGRIGAITAFLDDRLFAGFGLPDELPA